MGYKITHIKKIVPWFISIVVIYMIISKTDLSVFDDIFVRSNKFLFLLGIVVALFYHFFLSVWKYQYILDFFGVKVSDNESRIIKLGGMSFKAVMPSKAGEILRTFYLNKKHGVSYSKGINIIVFGYITRVIVLMLVILTTFLANKNILFLLFIFVCLSFLFIYFRKYNRLILYSILCELFLLANCFLMFKSVGINFEFYRFLITVPVILIITALPISIFGIGIREYAVISFFKDMAEFNILAFGGIMVSITESIIPMFLSLIFLKKFINDIIVNEKKDFDAINYYKRRLSNPLTRYRLNKRVDEVINTIKNYYENKKISVLDIGAADGFMLKKLCDNLKVEKASGIEPEKELISKNVYGLDIVEGRGENIPFKDNEFDLVLMCSVVEHVDDFDKTIKEAKRVLKSGGQLMITSVNKILDFIASKIGIKPDDHLRRFTKKQLIKILESYGFNIIETKSFGPIFYNMILAKKAR